MSRLLACCLLLALMPACLPAQTEAPWVGFGVFGGEEDLITSMQPWFSRLSLCRALAPDQTDSMRALAEAGKKHGARITFQSINVLDFPGGSEYEARPDYYALRSDGYKGQDCPDGLMRCHLLDFTSQAVWEATRAQLRYCITELGGEAFRYSDCVWPWWGGFWGYSESALAAYRKALLGQDEGLELFIAPGQTRQYQFWDWFEEYTGFRFTPEQLGLTNFAEYVPPPQPAADNTDELAWKRHFVYLFLMHWEFGRYLQQLGLEAERLGGRFEAVVNPEALHNGTSYRLFSRLAHAGPFFLELWLGPEVAVATYYNLAYDLEQALRFGRPFCLQGESGLQGAFEGFNNLPARPFYWDREANRALTYALGATGKFQEREDDYLFYGPDVMAKPFTGFTHTWEALIQSGKAFEQQALDGARRPPTRLGEVHLASVFHSDVMADHSWSQLHSLAPAVVESHFVFDGVDFPLTDDYLEAHDVLLWNAWESPVGFTERLGKWLEQPGKTLITHSFVPTRIMEGLHHLTWGRQVAFFDEAGAELARPLGLGKLTETEVKTGQVDFIAPELAPFLAEIKLGSPWESVLPLCACELGRPLIASNGQSLVTEAFVPGGGKVLYLNIAPPSDWTKASSEQRAFLADLMQALLRYAGVEPVARGNSTVRVLPFTTSAGQVFVLLDLGDTADSSAPRRFTAERQHYDHVPRLELRVPASTTFNVTDALIGEKGQLTSDPAGWLAIPMTERACRLLYVEPLD